MRLSFWPQLGDLAFLSFVILYIGQCRLNRETGELVYSSALMFIESTWMLQLVDGFKLESAAWWLWSLGQVTALLSFLATGIFSPGFIGLYWPHGQMHVVFVASAH